MLPAHNGAAGPMAAPNPFPLQFNSAGVSGSQAKNAGQAPDQLARDNDNADEQPAQQPQAQADADPDAEPEAEEPESDAEADLQADTQACREAFDLEAGDGRPVSAPNGDKGEAHQGAGCNRAARAGGSKVEEESKNAGAKADPGAESGTGGGAA